MSISSEISRLQTAKADLKTALENKGVTVPANATLDDYADLVDGIETGGSGFTWDDLASNQTPTGAVSFKTATAISAQAFYNRKGITSVDLTGITSIGNYAFAEDTNITEITNANDVVTLGSYAFRNCSKLGWLYFPKCTSITTGGYAFYGAGKTGYGVVFPAYVGTTQIEFMRSSNYTVCDLGPLVTALGTRHFYNGSKTYTVILRNPNQVVTAADTNRLDMKADSVIYVPSALVQSYQTASNWSTIYAEGVQFLPIEGSQYETAYADGTPIPTT